MKPSVYYNIPENTYLFEKNSSPEEKIRQWVLYEILGTFGVNINNIKIEVPVKVGTRTHYADIVIFNNHLPIIVIECKRKEDNNPTNSLDQAISYASAKEIQAKYAVATNGNYWEISENKQGTWQKINEIECYKSIEKKYVEIQDICILVKGLKDITPFFYKTINEKNICEFFTCYQSFFILSFSLINADKNIKHGVECLLRVLAHDPKVKNEYGIKKLKAAYSYFIDYAIDNGIREFEGNKELIEMTNKFEQMINTQYIFSFITENSKTVSVEKCLCDCALAFSNYLLQIRDSKKIVNFPFQSVIFIQDFIDAFLKDSIGAKFPDKNKDHEEFSNYCGKI